MHAKWVKKKRAYKKAMSTKRMNRIIIINQVRVTRDTTHDSFSFEKKTPIQQVNAVDKDTNEDHMHVAREKVKVVLRYEKEQEKLRFSHVTVSIFLCLASFSGRGAVVNQAIFFELMSSWVSFWVCTSVAI